MTLTPYIGLPFENKGRGPACYDCWGLLRLLYADLKGQALPSLDGGYSDAHDSARVERLALREISRAWEKVETPQPYDAVVFYMRGKASHIGMMIDADHFIHTLPGRESCIERINSSIWNRTREGFYRLKEPA